MPTFEASDGTRLAYQDVGTGRPMVFLASWSLAGRSWDYQTVPLVAEGFRCVALDRRGHGRSEEPGRGYDMDRLADDVIELLERLDLEDAVLVGFSVGAAEAVRAASRGPRRIGKLALIGTTTPFLPRGPDHPDGLDPAALAAFRDVLLADFPGWVLQNTDPFAPGASPGMKAWIQSMALEASLFALHALHRTLTTEDFRAELPSLSVPMLVVHGDRDATSPLDITGRPTAALARGARLKVYEGAPHGLMVTHRERLNADLLAFARE